METSQPTTCSFCEKSRPEIREVVRGQDDVVICVDCLVLCQEIINEHLAKDALKRNNKIVPKDIKKHLDKFVIGQDRAKRVLSVAVYNHYKRLRVEEEGVRRRKEITQAGYEKRRIEEQRLRSQEKLEELRKKYWANPDREELEQAWNIIKGMKFGEAGKLPPGEAERFDKALKTVAEAFETDELPEDVSLPVEAKDVLNWRQDHDSTIGLSHPFKDTSESAKIDPFDDEDDVELTKGNILMVGPTGSGKTLILETLANLLKVPFIISDATTLTEAGYVGEDVENIIKNLWLAAGRNTEAAAKGIICIDEVDKLAARTGTAKNSARDVGGEGVQQALLKVVESSKVQISPEGQRNRPQSDLITVDTRNILFVASGSFQGLSDIIARRLGKSRTGFGSDLPGERSELNVMHQLRPSDLHVFGLIPEFVGRFPVIVTFDELADDQLVEILWKPQNSLIAQYQKLFRIDGIKLHFEHAALAAMVKLAQIRGTGARGLRSVIESVMLDIMYDIPALNGVVECIVTEGCVVNKEKPTLIYDNSNSNFA